MRLTMSLIPPFKFSRYPKVRHVFVIYLMLTVSLIQPTQAALDELKGTFFESTRVIYPETARQGKSIVMSNNDDRNYLLQVYLSSINTDGLPDVPTRDFLVTPPIARLNAHQSITLRVLRVGGHLPTDRESVFYLNAILIPSEVPPDAKNDLPDAKVKYRTGLAIKVFWRPSWLDKSNAVEEAAGKLTGVIRGNVLTLSNPTPYYVTLRTLSIGGVYVPAAEVVRMIPPLGSQHWSLPSGTERTATIPVLWTAVKENGFDTTPFFTPVAAGSATSKSL